MRIAVLSDIHSNVFALEAVLEDLQRRSVEKTVDLGDILYGPIAPGRTCALLQEHSIVHVQGNQDRLIREVAKSDIISNPTLQLMFRELSEDQRSWLSSLPHDLYLTDDVYLCHGSPQSDTDYLLEDIANGRPQVREESEIVRMLGNVTVPLILCGHTHLPRIVELSSGQTVINPGSVGLPAYRDELPTLHAMENFSHHASYAIVEKRGAGWCVELIRVPYDVRRAAELARQNQRESWVGLLEEGRA